MDNPDELPGARKTTDEPQKRVRQITTDAKPVKKGRLAKFKEAFTGDDAQSVGSYILFDVLIPALKDLVVDMTQEAVRRLILGEGRARSSYSSNRQPVNTGRVSYNHYSSQPNRGQTWDQRRDEPRQRVRHFEQITVGHRAEAQDILETLENLIDQYHQATVADLYEMVGMQTAHTDHKYGWTNLRDGNVRLLTGGRYLLDLPDPVQL
jgi:hypothetical protein